MTLWFRDEVGLYIFREIGNVHYETTSILFFAQKLLRIFIDKFCLRNLISGVKNTIIYV